MQFVAGEWFGKGDQTMVICLCDVEIGKSQQSTAEPWCATSVSWFEEVAGILSVVDDLRCIPCWLPSSHSSTLLLATQVRPEELHACQLICIFVQSMARMHRR